MPPYFFRNFRPIRLQNHWVTKINMRCPILTYRAQLPLDYFLRLPRVSRLNRRSDTISYDHHDRYIFHSTITIVALIVIVGTGYKGYRTCLGSVLNRTGKAKVVLHRTISDMIASVELQRPRVTSVLPQWDLGIVLEALSNRYERLR